MLERNTTELSEAGKIMKKWKIVIENESCLFRQELANGDIKCRYWDFEIPIDVEPPVYKLCMKEHCPTIVKEINKTVYEGKY